MIKNSNSLSEFFSKKALKRENESWLRQERKVFFCYNSMTNLHRGGLCKKRRETNITYLFYEDVCWRKEKYPLKLNMC